MKHDASFQSELKTIEKKRLASRDRAFQYGLFCFALSLVSALWVSMAGGDWFMTSFVLLLGLALWLVIKYYMDDAVSQEYKSIVIPRILKGVDENLEYDLESGITREEFAASGLFPSPDRYESKDLVTGVLQKTAIRFSLVDADQQHTTFTTDSKGQTKSQTHYTKIFQGLFMIIDFHKNFSGSTLVQPAGIEFWSRLDGTRVELEDPDFHRIFSVSSTDQVEARYILSPSTMERLKRLWENFGSLSASFSEGNLFLAIDFPLDAFDPSVNQSLLENDQIKEISANFTQILAIVDDLDLNKRIWSKGAPPVIN